MKKLLCMLLVALLALGTLPLTLSEAEGTITLSVLVGRGVDAGATIDEIWWFQYLKYWFAQQGYNVDFALEEAPDSERVSLLLATNELPDMLWGGGLINPTTQVIYGMNEGMFMDWAPYFNEEDMPNAYAKLGPYLGIFTLPNGAIYSIPRISSRFYHSTLGSFPNSVRGFLNTTWLEEMGLDVPETLDDLVDILREYKEEHTGEEVYPLWSVDGWIEKDIWNALGFYGFYSLSSNGTTMGIRNGELALPCYTEQYRTFLYYMKTLYTEGLIHPDHFTLDTMTKRAAISEGNLVMICDGNLALTQTDETYANYSCYHPLTSDSCENPVGSIGSVIGNGTLTVSAQTEHPEIIVKMLDYLYTDMGSMLYIYGPMEGTEECIGVTKGWYIDDQGQYKSREVEEGKSESETQWRLQYIYATSDGPYDLSNVDVTMYKLAGYDREWNVAEVTDAVTGEIIEVPITNTFEKPNADSQWRRTSTDAWVNNVTAVILPTVFMSEEDNERVTDLQSAIDTFVATETTKFITGARSLDDIDDYFEQLRALGVEEYIAIYEKAYASYMESIFG